MLGQYRLVEKIGVGGMGEVWRATDTILGREVAIKILPTSLAAEPERLARFEREAKLLASLNHPNIATIHGLHEADGVRFLAMELVAGEDLAERLKSGALPLPEALDVARQIAEALEAAHEQGVIHRDLKPANVKRTPDGRVKVLDFGLAKAVDVAPAAAPRDAALSPTITSLGTVAGVILGTAAYMSPEQARGRPVDKRADVWAFGCVLFEMLSGKRPFDGETISDTLAAVLAKDPDWEALPASIPARVRDLLARCLEKDPKRRLRDIGEARIEMENLLASRTASGSIPALAEAAARAAVPPPRPAWRSPAVIVFASLCAVAIAVAAAALHSTRGPAESERLVVRATLALPKGLALPREDRNIAVSPDGTQVVVSLNTKNGSSPASLHLRDLSRLEFRQLPGTEGATYPFWSPDGKSIAFFAGTDLKRIDLADGIVRVICPAPAGRGGAWSTQGSIVFAPSAAGGLSIVDQAGGVASPVTQPASASESQRVPAMLPDGRRFLYYAMDAAKPGVYAFDPASKTSRFVVASDAEAVFVEPSSLVFARDENLVVQPFDLTRLELTGSPRPIAAGVNWDANRAALGVSLSSRGTLVYQTVVRAGTYKLAWMDRKGERTPIPVEPIAFAGGSLSSDGRRAAMNLAGDRGESFLAALDLDRGITTRIGEPNAKRYFGALLSRDGQRVITVDANQSGQAIVSFPFGGGAPTQLLEAEPGYEKSPTSITPDGRTLLLARVPLSDKLGDIMTLDLEGHEPPKPLIATPESEGSPLISPSGDIVAYLALNEASVLKLVRYPTPSTPVQVSPTAVSTYGWLSASELYWGDPSSKMWSASVSTKNGQLDVGAPRVMFNGAPLDKDVGIIAYDIARERFLIAIEASAPEEPQLILVSDWRQEAGAAQPARK